MFSEFWLKGSWFQIDAYARSPLQDSRLFGPSPWKILAATNEKKGSWASQPLAKIFWVGILLWRPGVCRLSLNNDNHTYHHLLSLLLVVIWLSLFVLSLSLSYLLLLVVVVVAVVIVVVVVVVVPRASCCAPGLRTRHPSAGSCPSSGWCPRSPA